MIERIDATDLRDAAEEGNELFMGVAIQNHHHLFLMDIGQIIDTFVDIGETFYLFDDLLQPFDEKMKRLSAITVDTYTAIDDWPP